MGPAGESGLGHGSPPRVDKWNAKSAGESGQSDSGADSVWHRYRNCGWNRSFLRRHLRARRCARKSSCQGLPVSWLIAGDEIRRTVETPLPNAADVQVDEVRVRIVAHTAASQTESSLTQFEGVDAG